MNVHKKDHLGDYLSMWHFDEDFLVYKDGSLGSGFKIEGIDISCFENSQVNSITEEFENFINSLDEEYAFQIFHNISDDVSEKIYRHQKLSEESSGSYSRVKDSRIHFLKENASLGNYYNPSIYFFLRGKGIKRSQNRNLFSKVVGYEKIYEDEYKEHKSNFLKTNDNFLDYLEKIGLRPRPIIQDEWHKLLFQYFNLSRSKEIGIPKLKKNNEIQKSSLINQLVLSDCQIENEFFKIDDYYYKTLTVKAMPSETYSSMGDLLSKLPFHYSISQCAFINNQSIEISKLEMQRRIAHSMASGAKNVSDIEAESKLSNLESILEELANNREKVISTNLTFIIWDKDKKSLNNKANELLRNLTSLNQMEAVNETFNNFKNFVTSWPGSCELLNGKKLKTSNVAHLAPIFSSWQGNKKPVVILPNRDLSLFGLDYFDNSLPNWNALTIGGSGSGKSFTIGSILLQIYGETIFKGNTKFNPKIVIIDNGKSSENLVEACDGELVDVTVDSNICLNIFDLNEGAKSPSSLKIKSILAVLELILKDPSKGDISKKEKALLEQSIYEIYKKVENRYPILSDLKDYFEDHDSTELNEFAQILYSWTGNTAYGKILDGKSNIDLNKDVTSIEIKGLDNFPDLKDVFMLIITSFVQNESEKNLDIPYLLICDEAHRLFKTPSTKDYILYCYRVFRKYNCSINCITQNYKDFLTDPEVADAIFPNTSHLFFLRQKKIDWDDFQKVFSLNHAELKAIKTLEVKKGEYSDIFYMQDDNRAILRLINDDLAYWVCTSAAKDKSIILDYQNKYPNLSKIEVLEKISKEIDIRRENDLY